MFPDARRRTAVRLGWWMTNSAQTHMPLAIRATGLSIPWLMAVISSSSSWRTTPAMAPAKACLSAK